MRNIHNEQNKAFREKGHETQEVQFSGFEKKYGKQKKKERSYRNIYNKQKG